MLLPLVIIFHVLPETVIMILTLEEQIYVSEKENSQCCFDARIDFHASNIFVATLILRKH